MRKILLILTGLFLVSLFFISSTIAQEVVSTASNILTATSDLVAVTATNIAVSVPSIAKIGGDVDDLVGLYMKHKGSSLGIIFIIVQVLLKLLKTGLLDKMAGKWKLGIVALTTLICAIASNLISGGSIANIFGDTAILTAFQVLYSQVIIQAKKKA